MPHSPRPHRRLRTRLLAATALALALALTGGGIAIATPASATERGLAPTAANITGNGSFSVTNSPISNASGFGGGRVYTPNSHSIPFITTLTGPRVYAEIDNASHLFPQSVNAITSRALVSWFKRFLDNDGRFTPFARKNPGGTSDFRRLNF